MFALISVYGGSIFAGPINVAETTDFETTNSSTTNLGSFDIGVNIVSGSVDRDEEQRGDYGDFWDAYLPPGMQITGIEIERAGNGSGFQAMVAEGIIATVPFLTRQWLSSDGTYLLPGDYPFDSSGQYYFGIATILTPASSYTYEWRITVASSGAETTLAPESSILLLLSTGLEILGLITFRHNNE